MPTPAKTSPEALVAIALDLVRARGVDAVTVAEVAAVAGVKGPSLYKHFADREALLRAAEIEVLHRLEGTLRAGMAGAAVRERLMSLAEIYRDFALGAPHLYGLLYRGSVADDPAIAAAFRNSARPLFEELERAGLPADEVLPRSRTLVSFLHGFVSMEIAKAFRLGGDVDEAFTAGLETILAGL